MRATRAGAVRALERRRQTLRHPAAGDAASAIRTGGRRRAAQQRAEELDGRRVGPVEVVEDEHERLARRELLEQRTHRPVAAVALVLDGDVERARKRSRARGRRARARCGRPRRGAASEAGSSPRRYSSSASTKTENGRSRSSSEAEPERTRHPCASARRGELREQAGLADPGLADQLDRGRRPDRAPPRAGRAIRAPRRARRDARYAGTFLVSARIVRGTGLESEGARSGWPPDVGVGGRRPSSAHDPLPAPPPPRAATSAASYSPRSKGTTARFATGPPSPRAAPAATRSGGRSRRQPRTTRSRSSRSTSPSAPPRPP